MAEKILLKWLKPEVVELSNKKTSSGLCDSGAGDSGTCFLGSGAALEWCEAVGAGSGGMCQNGPSAGDICNAGVGN